MKLIILVLISVLILNAQEKKCFKEYVYKYDSRKAYVNKHKEANKRTLIFSAEKADSIFLNSKEFKLQLENSKYIEVMIQLVDVKTGSIFASYINGYPGRAIFAIMPYAYYGEKSHCLYTVLNEKVYVGISNYKTTKANEFNYDILVSYRIYN